MRVRGLPVLIAIVAPVLIAGSFLQLGSPTPALSLRSVLHAPSVSPDDHHDLSRPLRGLPPSVEAHREEKDAGVEEQDKGVLPHPATVPGALDTVIQATLPAPRMPATTTNFDGLGNGFTGPGGTFVVAAYPPDANGDVGPNHYVQVVNLHLAVFSKTGTPLLGPVALNSLWSGFGGGCQTNNDGDPTVKYDRIADRWIITQYSVTTTPYLECVAISQTGDPTGAYYRYAFSYGTNFPDYPKLAVWPDAYYVTSDLYAGGTTFVGASACAYDRTKMLAGLPATQQCFTTSSFYGRLLPSDLDGARLPPAGSPNYLVALNPNTQLATWRFHVDWANPANTTLTGPSALSTSFYAYACDILGCIPQPGTSQLLDAQGGQLMYRLAYRNFGDHESLVVNHSVSAGSSVGVRWYELRVVGGNLSVFQEGTFAPDASYRWMGSIAQDQAGNIALGYSLSSSAIYPSIAYTGRLVGDAAGVMTQGEAIEIAGAGSQQTSSGTPSYSGSRWGDYSAMAVDPTDDCTFWYTSEYLPSNGIVNWATRIASFKFPGCGPAPSNDFSISAAPTSLTIAAGGSANATISTALTLGTAGTVTLAETISGAGPIASLSPASITAGGSSTLTVTAGASVAAGTYRVTVTGTEGTAVHATTVSVTVTVAAVPGAPTLTANRSRGRGVQLNWTIPASNGSPITAYRIYRSTTSGAEIFLREVGTGPTSYVDSSTARPAMYFYKITAVNGIGEGRFSNEASARAR